MRCPIRGVRRGARLAERVGFDSIWAGDHVSFENPILDVTVALSTFAAVTSRITIGAGIVLLPLRPPALVAKAFSSLDWLSRGRVVLGVGVGGEGLKDFEAVGSRWRSGGHARTRRWRRSGRCSRLRPRASRGVSRPLTDVSIEPLPAQPGGPPLWVGGRSAAALRTAGRAR